MFAEKMKRWIIVAVVLAIGIVGGSVATGIVVATGGDGDDQPITGSALAACSAAALAGNPGATVTETEVEHDGAAYEVELRLADGSEVEVNLDANCQVTGQESDDDDDDDDGDDAD